MDLSIAISRSLCSYLIGVILSNFQLWPIRGNNATRLFGPPPWRVWTLRANFMVIPWKMWKTEETPMEHEWNMNGTWYPYDQFITGKWPIYSWYLWKMMFTLYTRYIQVPSNFDAVCQYMLLDSSTISTVALEARSKLIVQWPSQCRSRHKFFGI